MEGIAKQKYIRAAPKKLRKIAELVKNKPVNVAESILKFYPSRLANHLYKAIHSATTNLKNKMETEIIKDEEVIVKNIRIEQGPTWKRLNERAMGRANIIRKRTAHIIVKVEKK